MHSDSTRSLDKPEPMSSDGFSVIPHTIDAQIGTPLARVSGPVNEFTHQITLPEHSETAEDMGIYVSVLLDGVEYVVVLTPMPEEGSFSFSSHLPFNEIIDIEGFQLPINMKVGLECGTGQRCNCCSGGGSGCAKMCECCDGPAFDCNLVECTASCGTWPPECT